MLEAFFQLAPDAAATADALAPYAPSGVLLAAAWLANRVLSPVLTPAKEAAEAFRDYFACLGEMELAEAKHREAEVKHWAKEEELLERIVGGLMLPSSDTGLKVLGQ